MKRKKKTPKQLLADKCIALWKKLFLKTKCEICGGTWKLTGHHFYYKGSFKHLIYEMLNCVTLCGRCHFSLHFGGGPKKVENKIIAVRGDKWFKKLTKMSQVVQKSGYLTLDWYEKQYAKLKRIEKKHLLGDAKPLV